MSDIKIQPSATGTATVTITAPTTNTARVITLPDSAGTLLDENSSVPAANLTGTIANARFPSTLPAISGANLTGVGVAGIASSADGTAITIDSSERVGVGTGSPTVTLDVNGAVKVGVTSQSASNAGAGTLRWNSGKLEFSDGTIWGAVSNTPPTITTAGGSLGTVFDGARGSTTYTITATDPENTTITFSVSAGSLPAGASIHSTTGVISGFNAVGSNTTSTFTITATDVGGETAEKEFSITINAPIINTYNYTGAVQTWTKPAGVTSIYAVMWGAGGGGGNPSGNHGGAGGYTYGNINVSNVSNLKVIVGGLGEGENNWFNNSNGNGCGGGLSGIFIDFTSDRSATWSNSIMLAGGGGGGGNAGGQAGSGGGSSGSNASSGGDAGQGGTQSSGAATSSQGGTCTSNCTSDKLRGSNGCGGDESNYGDGGSWPSRYWGGVWSAGAGGNGCNAGGGGGGYYGGSGGGGSPNGGSAGGGSGYIGGHSNAAVSNASTTNNGASETPAGTSHANYTSGRGVGGAAELDGTHGLVVIVY